MNRKLKSFVFGFPLALALVLFLGIFFADDWLESSAGRAKLERALADSLGMPVSLQGDLNIRLIPSVGVSGTDLSIGAFPGGRSFVQSRIYQVDLALLPLIDGKLQILMLNAADGSLDPSQFQNLEKGRTSSSDEEFHLPEIESLSIENFRVNLPGSDDSSLLVHRLELLNFRAGEASPVHLVVSLQSQQTAVASITARSQLFVQTGANEVVLELQSLKFESGATVMEGITGRLSWQAEPGLFETDLTWLENGIGSARLSSSHSTPSFNGTMELEYATDGMDVLTVIALEMEPAEQGIDFPAIRAALGSQQLTGRACLLTEKPGSLNLVMTSDYLDLDQMETLIAGGTDAQSFNPADHIPIEMNILFSARELHAGGAIAYNSEIRMGREPDCSLFQN